MSTILSLNSSDADASGSTHNFTVSYTPPLVLKQQYEVALVRANLWNSWFNISSAIGNNTMDYNNGITTKTVSWPDGQYSLEDIDTFLRRTLEDNSDDDLDFDGDRDIELRPDYAQGKVELIIRNAAYSVDFDVANPIYPLLGFSAAQVASPITASSTYGANIVDITRGINQFVIRCDLLKNSNASIDNATPRNTLFSFQMEVPSFASMTIEPNQKLFIPLQNSVNAKINSINIQITDQDNNLIDLNGEDVSLLLELRPVR